MQFEGTPKEERCDFRREATSLRLPLPRYDLVLRPVPRYGQALQGVTEQKSHVKGLEASLAGGKDKLSL